MHKSDRSRLTDNTCSPKPEDNISLDWQITTSANSRSQDYTIKKVPQVASSGGAGHEFEHTDQFDASPFAF